MRSRASLSACERLGVAGRLGGIDLGGGNAQAGRGEVEPVELEGQLEQRLVAARLHVGDEWRARRPVRRPAPPRACDREESAKPAVEVGALLSRRMGMTAFRAFGRRAFPPRIAGQWRAVTAASTLTP